MERVMKQQMIIKKVSNLRELAAQLSFGSVKELPSDESLIEDDGFYYDSRQKSFVLATYDYPEITLCEDDIDDSFVWKAVSENKIPIIVSENCNLETLKREWIESGFETKSIIVANDITKAWYMLVVNPI